MVFHGVAGIIPMAALLSLIAMGCAREIGAPPMTLAMHDYDGRRAEGFLPESEAPREVEVILDPVVVLPDRDRQPDTRHAPDPWGLALPESTATPAAANAQLVITTRRQGNVMLHSGDATGTSIRTGDRTFHSIGDTSGTTHHMGRVSIHHFGDVTGMSTQTGNIQIHNFSDGSGGVTIQSGNRSITTIDR